jgi:hypothetical protein
MRKFNKLAVLILLLNITSFQPLFAQCNWWVKSFGGVFADNVIDMKTDKNGNMYICGYFSGTVNLDNVTLTSAGDKDVFVAKLNSSGGILWAKQGGGVYADQATALDIDAIGNVYVGGQYNTSATFNGNILTNASSFVLSYTSNGNFNWVKNIASAGSIDDLVVYGDFFTIVGYRKSSSSNTFESINLDNSSNGSGFLARYVLNGSISKATSCPISSNKESNKLTTDLLGNVSFLTKFYGNISIEGKTISSVGGDDLIVLNYSPTLALNWYKTGGGSGYEYPKNITTDANGNVYILGTIESSGTFSGTTVNAPSNHTYIIVKYLKNGDFSWVKSTGSTSGIDNYDKNSTIIFDNSNSLYITGKIYGGDFKFDNTTVSSDNNYGGFILKCSTSGDFQDFKSTNATLNNISSTITGIIGVGNFQGDYKSFSSKKLISKGLEDFFMCKLSSLSDLDATSSPELCMVTLDPITNKNKLVWKKPDSKNIDKYIIYRLNAHWEYDSIGYQNYAGNNYFIDNAISPEKKAERYTIGLIDVCGNKSDFSDDGIKTMHLMIYPGPNKKWQLLWSPYTGADDPYYRIYRGTTPTNKVLIDSLTGDEDQMFMYTDINSPSGTVYYSVEAVTGEDCEETQGPTVAGRIRSNNAYYTAETMGLDNLQSLQTMIFPNPSQGLISIRFEGKEGLYENSSLSIINHLGQSILSQNLNDVNTDLNLSELSKGIYFVKIENGDSYSIQKIVLE